MTGTFTLFEKLPTELRLKIWEFAIPGPRVIYLDLVRCEDNTAHAAVEDEKHDSLSVSESLEEGTTTAENADLDTLEEGIEQSSIGNTTVDDDMSGSEESEEATSASDSESEEENATAFRADCLRRVCYSSARSPARSHRNTTRKPSQHLTLRLEHTLTSIGTRSTYDMMNSCQTVIITGNFYIK
jgi:hypothetical protein